MDTNELKAEVDKFLQKLQQSIVKPAGPTPTPKEPKAPEGVSKPPAKTQTVKASDFVKGKLTVIDGISNSLAEPEMKGKPNVLKPEFLEKAKQCVSKQSAVTDNETGKPIEGAVVAFIEATEDEKEPEPPIKFVKITQGEKTYTVAVEDDDPISSEEVKLTIAKTKSLLEEAAHQDFYEELLKVVNLLADTVEHPPLGITLFLKGDKYEFVKVTIVDETAPSVVPEAAMEAPPVPAPIPIAYPEKIQVELSFGKDLVDVLHELLVAFEKFMKQQDGGIIA